MAKRASLSRKQMVLTPAAQREADIRKVRTTRMGPRDRRGERQAEKGSEAPSRTTRSPVDWHRKYRLRRCLGDPVLTGAGRCLGVLA